jgi:hypothetical protein
MCVVSAWLAMRLYQAERHAAAELSASFD